MALEPEIEIVEEERAASAGVVRGAAILSLGNLASRVLGLVREAVISNLFGATGLVSVFAVASFVPTMVYDLLIGGLISAALVPVLSEYAARPNRADLWRVASVVVSFGVVVLGASVLVLEILAPQLVSVLGGGYRADLQATATEMVRIVLPATLFLGLAGIVAALLFALKRFQYPASAASVFTATVIVSALVLSRWIGIYSLLVGIVAGALLQLGVHVWGVRDWQFRFRLDWHDPALQRILKLYAPVVLGLVVANVGIAIDRALASFTGEQSVAWMRYATTLIQFPMGLVAAAVSFAILPNLSRQSTVNNQQSRGESNYELRITNFEFQSTLAFGLKLVLLLILPATVALFVLAKPIVALLFQHGAFTGADTEWTSLVLRLYLLSLPLAAIDQPLVFAFYARKNTLTPNLVAVAGVVIYTIVALALIRPFGFIGLVLANGAQLSGHALIMLWLTHTRLGGLRRQGIGMLGVKVMLASLLLGLSAFGALGLVERAVTGDALGAELARVVAPGAIALGVFLVGIWLLRVREANDIARMVWARVRRAS